MSSFPVEEIREDFPILKQKVRKSPLIYLDNAATAQHPLPVIDLISKIYRDRYASVHRGVHFLSDRMTAEFETARKQVAEFTGVEDSAEIVFTRGTTESINLVSRSWGEKFINLGDSIVVTALEHHANFVPWQSLAKKCGAKFTIIEVDQNGTLDMDGLQKALEANPKIVAFTLMSNVLGTILPVKDIAKKAKAAGAMVFVDAAQGMGKAPVKVPDLGPIDFLAFSGHKICGPTGTGVLWGRRAMLEAMDPFHYGGAMIEKVGDENSSWTKIPWKFEAGTPNIVGAIALGAALDYVENIGRDKIAAWESYLLKCALTRLKDIPDLHLFGLQDGEDRGAVISFGIKNVHPHDIGSFLDTKGIAIRVGHHCAQPLMRRLGVEGTARASFYFYNSEAEINSFVQGVEEARNLFRG